MRGWPLQTREWMFREKREREVYKRVRDICWLWSLSFGLSPEASTRFHQDNHARFSPPFSPLTLPWCWPSLSPRRHPRPRPRPALATVFLFWALGFILVIAPLLTLVINLAVLGIFSFVFDPTYILVSIVTAILTLVIILFSSC